MGFCFTKQPRLINESRDIRVHRPRLPGITPGSSSRAHTVFAASRSKRISLVMSYTLVHGLSLSASARTIEVGPWATMAVALSPLPLLLLACLNSPFLPP